MPSFTYTSWSDFGARWPVLKATCKSLFDNGYSVVLTIGKETRSQEQNRLMWPLLQDLSKQAMLNNEHLSAEEWKCVCMSSMLIVHKEITPKMRQGLENEIVMLNYSTRQLGKKDFSALIEIIYATGVQRGVQFTEKSNSIYEQWAQEG